MGARVLVVDDSRFFRRRLTEILSADAQIEVIDVAEDGRTAVDKVIELQPDVVTMDIEMPVMDGISAVRQIMAARPTPVLMFSSLTHEGAQATLQALEAGAVDFLPKRFEDIAHDRDEATAMLRARVRALAEGLPKTTSPPPQRGAISHAGRRGSHQLVLVGASTGGPVAVQQVLQVLPADFPLPIMVIQHMPASFTRAFADRLNQQCQIMVREAQDNDVLRPGNVLVAPGGQQAQVFRRGNELRVRVVEATPDQHYKPSVDIAFGTAAKALGRGVLAVVLTGMGHDGRDGARALKQAGSDVWAQDEATSVIYGMPMAVIEAGLAAKVLPLGKIGASILEGV